MLLHVNGEQKNLQTICISHTRLLVMQTFKVFNDLNCYTKFEGDTCVKNNSNEEERAPSKTAQLLFGTPTCITYWINKGELDVRNVNFLVIDEADALLNKHSTLFPSTKNLLNIFLPQKIQYAFFSSTFKNSIIQYIKKKFPGIVTILLRRNHQRVQKVNHFFTKVDKIDQAKDVIYDLVTSVANGQTLKLAKEFADFLISKGVQCRVFSSDLSAREIDETLDEFRKNEYKVLITSDILSRGIDLPNTYLVINLQTPIQVLEKRDRFNFNNTGNHQETIRVAVPDCDAYYHRAGRAGRFGRNDLCFTIVLDPKDETNLKLFCSEKNLNIPLKYIDKVKIADHPKETKIQIQVPAQEQWVTPEPVDLSYRIEKKKMCKVKKENNELELRREIEELNNKLFEKEIEISQLKAQNKRNESLLIKIKQENSELKNKIKNMKDGIFEKVTIPIPILDSNEMISYKKGKRIGRGYTSEIYEVIQETKLAMKVLDIEMLSTNWKEENESDEEENLNQLGIGQVKQYLRECEILNELEDENIIKTYGFFIGDCEEQPAIILEWCESNLKKRIKKINKEERIQIIFDVSSTMKKVHSKGIIHRGLKLENILLDMNNRVKLSDFGLFKFMNNEDGTMAGALKYMSPELLQGRQDYDEKVDVYAFGVVLFLILTEGEYPDISIGDVVMGKQSPIPNNITQFSAQLIRDCWSFQSKDRPSFSEVCDRLEGNGDKLI